MTDFSLSGKALLLRELNTRYGTFFAASDIDFIDMAVLTGDVYNTQITAYATDTGNYRGTATFSYNRVSLSKVIPEAVIFTTTAGITTSTDLITRLNTLYGTAFSTDDIQVENVTPTALTPSIGIYTLKAAAGSLIYLDTLDIYFGDAATIRDWVRYPYYEYQSNGNVFSLCGKSLLTDDTFVIGKKGTFTPTSAHLGVVLDTTGTYSLSTTALTAGTTAMRLRSGQLLEVTGPSYETSYDSTNNCLSTVPALPPVFGTLSPVFPYTGTVVSGLMQFSTSFDLSQWNFRNGITYYVDATNGSDLAVGSSAAPLKTLTAALTKSPLADTVVLLNGGSFYLSSTLSDRKVGIYGDGSTKPTLHGEVATSGWTAYSDTNNTFQYLSTGMTVAGVIDNSVTDTNGLVKYLTKVSTPALCANTPGSFCVTSTALLIQTSNGRQPDSNVTVIGSGTGLTVTGASSVYLENVLVRNTDVGIVADCISLTNRPFVMLNDVDVLRAVTAGCLSNYGADVYSQNCTFQDGYSYGTYHGPDRQTIALGSAPTFLEVGCTVSNILRAGSGACRGSQAVTGAVGIRFDSTYKTVDGYPIEEYGIGTYVAHFETSCSDNKQTSAFTGALYASGKAAVGSTTYGRSAMYLYSCHGTNSDVVTLMNYRNGEIHLYNTPVGPIANYNQASAYKFIYTSSQIPAIEPIS